MKLSPGDLYVLKNLHANSDESATLRRELLAEGLKFCRHCAQVLPLESFRKTPRGLGGYHSTCRGCDTTRKKGAGVGFIPVRPIRGNRPEIQKRWRANNREKTRAIARKASKRQYHERLSLGMSPQQAAYKEPWGEYRAAWDALRRSR